MKIKHDLVFKKIIMRQKTNEMNFLQFIEAIEKVAYKVYNYSSKYSLSFWLAKIKIIKIPIYLIISIFSRLEK